MEPDLEKLNMIRPSHLYSQVTSVASGNSKFRDPDLSGSGWQWEIQSPKKAGWLIPNKGVFYKYIGTDT